MPSVVLIGSQTRGYFENRKERDETAHLQEPPSKIPKDRTRRAAKKTSEPKVELTESVKRRDDRHVSFLSSGRQTRTAFRSGPAGSNRFRMGLHEAD
jgi:hypothetical protein